MRRCSVVSWLDEILPMGCRSIKRPQPIRRGSLRSNVRWAIRVAFIALLSMKNTHCSDFSAGPAGKRCGGIDGAGFVQGHRKGGEKKAGRPKAPYLRDKDCRFLPRKSKLVAHFGHR